MHKDGRYNRQGWRRFCETVRKTIFCPTQTTAPREWTRKHALKVNEFDYWNWIRWSLRCNPIKKIVRLGQILLYTTQHLGNSLLLSLKLLARRQFRHHSGWELHEVSPFVPKWKSEIKAQNVLASEKSVSRVFQGTFDKLSRRSCTFFSNNSQRTAQDSWEIFSLGETHSPLERRDYSQRFVVE